MTSIATQIDSLESELEALRAERRANEHRVSILEFENDQLRRRCDHLQAERDFQRDKATEIKVLMDQCAGSLVRGITEFNKRQRDRQAQIMIEDEPPALTDQSGAKE